MKVSKLIELLQACDPDALVLTEGCDCTGPADGIDSGGFYTPWDGSKELPKVPNVTICRNDDLFEAAG